MAKRGRPAHTGPGRFENAARRISQFTGSTAAFVVAAVVVLTWAATGPPFRYSETVAALEGASNRLVNVEDLSEEELSTLHRHYQTLAELARSDVDVRQSHSVDEAQARHRSKVRHRRSKTG